MFERFTDQSRRVLVLAQEEARLLGHNFLGTEHILLGLLRQDDGRAAKALTALGVSLESARERVEHTVGPSDEQASGTPPFTPRAKSVLELSLREALSLGHEHIGPEHLLLGLVREGEGVAAQVLATMSADPVRVRHQVVALIEGVPAPPPPPPPSPSPSGPAAGDVEKRVLAAAMEAVSDQLGRFEEELAALKAENDRLRSLLARHGIDPDPVAGSAPVSDPGGDGGDDEDAPPSPS